MSEEESLKSGSDKCQLDSSDDVMNADKISKLFVDLLSAPSPTSAKFIADNESLLQFMVDWSATDVVKKEKVAFTKIYTVLKNSLLKADGQGGLLGVGDIIESPPIPLGGNFYCRSKCGSKNASISKKSPDPKETGELLQILDRQSVFKTYDLKELDKHGVIYTSPLWGCTMSFNTDGTKLLYLAEAKIDKAVPFFTSFGKQPDTNANTSADKAKSAKGEEFAFRQSWGEKMSEAFQSVIVVLDIEQDTFEILDLPDKIFPSDLQWVNGSAIIGVGYSCGSSRLGLAACTNRSSRIFRVDIDGSNFSYLSNVEKAAFSPRPRPDGGFVIWQERNIDAPHKRANEIIGMALVEGESPYVLYDSNPSSLIPIYDDFPQDCWTSDGCKFLTVTTNDIETTLLSFRVGKDKVPIQPQTQKKIGEVLSVGKKIVIGTLSSKIETASLCLLDFSGESIKQYQVTSGRPVVKRPLRRLVVNGQASPPSFYYGPAKDPASPDQTFPLVVIVHGGPHGSYVDQFGAESGLLLQLGFGVLFVNYIGSTGGKSDSVDHLCGRVGRDDLVDCQNIVQSLLEHEPSVDSKNIFVFGGSHGGFLGAHLMSSYPDFYKAAVLLNPVTDLTAMVSSTDIPDWCYAEAGAGVDYRQNSFLPYVQTLEDAKKFMDCSPILNASKVKGDILLLLGNQDLRVPMSQGFAYYRALKSFNKQTEVRVYNDNHSLYKVPSRFDVMVHSALWFCARLRK